MSQPDWKQIQQESPIVDLHIHPSMQQQLFRRNLNMRFAIDRTFHGNPMSVRASFPRMKMGGYDVILSTMYVPEKGIINDFPIIRIFSLLRPDLWKKLFRTSPFDATLRMMDDMEKAVSQTNGFDAARMACSVNELKSVMDQPKSKRPIIVIHAVEGGHSLGSEDTGDERVMRNLETLFSRGVASLTLAHFYPNRIVNPCYPFPEDIARLSIKKTLWRDLTKGLTPLGVKVVERMIELGMLIDISHCTPVARKEIYEIIDASGKQIPLLATHTGAYEINPSPYNLSDWEIRRIARDGGVIGVIFMAYWLMPKESRQGINSISRHIQYLVNTGGSDVVGLGTDFDGFTTPPDDLDNAAQMGRLIQRLVVDGYSEEQIKKIMGNNALRAICSGWRKLA